MAQNNSIIKILKNKKTYGWTIVHKHFRYRMESIYDSMVYIAETYSDATVLIQDRAGIFTTKVKIKNHNLEKITRHKNHKPTEKMIKMIEGIFNTTLKEEDEQQVKKANNSIRKITDEERLSCSEDPIIKIRNLDVVFGRGQTLVHAVKNLSLNIKKGEVLGIVGESGSGKSTTGNAMLGLVDRENGSLKIKGREIPQKTKYIKGEIGEFLVKTIQMIFQDPASSLNPHKTIKKIVSEGLMNVDVKQVFAKTFDGITAKQLSILLKGKPQPKILENLSLTWVSSEIENDRFEKVTKILYDQAIESLYLLNKDYARYAANYLRMRKNVRDEFLVNAKSNSKIIDKLVIDIIESVGLNQPMLKRYPLEFSGGQQQRVGISRAVVLKPEIIVADEPISALDVSIQAQVVNIFNDLKDKLNLTIIFIAHDLRMVEYISDRIIVMYKGEVLEMGNTKEIVSNPIHPYTKSLIGSIPSIDKINKTLVTKELSKKNGWVPSHKCHWYAVNKTEHYVFGTSDEIKMWMGGKDE